MPYIENFSDLNPYLLSHSELGHTVQLTLPCGGEELALSLTLAERP